MSCPLGRLTPPARPSGYIVTVTGSGVREPANVEARIGTSLAELIAAADPKPRFGVGYNLPVIFAGNKSARELVLNTLREKSAIEVVENIRILGRGGGYIIAPCHNIQANTPPENVVAMYKKGYEEGLKAR